MERLHRYGHLNFVLTSRVHGRLSTLFVNAGRVDGPWKYMWDQSCPWIGLTHGLGWVRSGRVGSRFLSFWWVGLCWVHYSKSTKNLKGLC